MTDEALLRLALQACHDHTAQPVLGDAVLESGWYDQRVMELVLGRHQLHWHGSRAWPERWKQTSADRLYGRFMRRAGKPDRRWCRAVAATLLCGDWDAVLWPGAEGAYRPPPKPEELYRYLRELWPQQGIPEMFYGPSALFGINRQEPPQRLQGITSGIAMRVYQEQMEEAMRRIQEQYSRVIYAPDVEETVIESAAQVIRKRSA